MTTMEVRFNNLLAIDKECRISNNGTLYFNVKDDVEGDIELRIRLLFDSEKRSYTRFNAIDSHSGDVLIYNAPNDRFVSLSTPIQIGTYGGKYKLSMTYSLDPSVGRDRRIQVEFNIAEM